MSLNSPGNAQRVVGLFGGAPKMSEICGLKPHLPWQWLKAGTIPYSWWLHICARGVAAGVPITPIDFIVDLTAVFARLPSSSATSGESPASSATPA